MGIDTVNLVENIVSKALHIKDYTEIISTFSARNLSTDHNFQKTFNRFYVVRRNQAWRDVYYSFFEDNKHRKDLTFSEILYHLYDNTGQIEHSFSSKLLATINPEFPIWDSYVLNHIGLVLEGRTKAEQLQNRVKLYDDIMLWYTDFLKTEDAKEAISIFDGIMPHYTHLTPVKKIDYIIWGVRV